MKYLKRFTPLVLAIALLGGSMMSGGFAVPTAHAQTVTNQALQAQIAGLLAQIAALQAQITAAGGTSTNVGTLAGVPSTFRFNRNLTVGSRGIDVQYLQMILNQDPVTRVNVAGSPGGPGSETSYFGPLTRSAVIKFQNKYATEVLLPIGLNQGTGFVGIMTRAKLNALLIAMPPTTTPPTTTPPTTTPPTTTPPQVSSTLNVTAGAQQTGTLLLPPGAVRVPVLRLNMANTGSSPVTVTSMTVQLGGVVQLGALDSLAVLDENGNQIGISRVVGTNRQIVFNEPFTISGNTTSVIVIGANMAGALTSYQGQTVQVSLIDIRSNAQQTIVALPINGPTFQINATLPIGTATVVVGTTGTTAISRDIGTTDQIFGSVRITAGSQEDLFVKSIRWTQNGSAGTSDLANVEAVIDGVTYPATVSGRTYITNFGTNGVRIQSGFSKEITVRGDIVSGAGRTVQFDIDRSSDIYLSGSTFGFGVAPTASATAGVTTGAEFTTGTPFFSGSVITITGGTVNISRSTSVPAQNISPNVPGQTLGGFDIEVLGEGVTANQIQFTATITRASGSSAVVTDIKSVTLVSSSGTVSAGPVDASGSGTSGTITFSNVFLPEGRNTYTLKGTLGASFREGDIITVTLTPSTALTGIRGQTSGIALTAAPTSSISGHPITVRSATVSVSVSPTPIAQTVVAGAQDFTFSQIQFDATASGEDIRLSALPVRFTFSGNAQNISGCQLYNGNTALNTGSNAINPSASTASGTDLTFTLDAPLTISKGGVTTLQVKCDISPSATAGSTFSFGAVTAPVGVGVQSGQTITSGITTSVGQTMTIAAAGTFTVSQSVASPTYQIVPAGSTANIATYTFRAGNEPVNIRQVALQLTGTSASSSPADLASVVLQDTSGNDLGTVFFGGSRTATVQLTRDFIVPQNGERDMIVRATFAQIGTGQAASQGAFVKIDYNGDSASDTRGIGASSGSTLASASTGDTATAGARVFKSIPVINTVSMPSTTLISGDVPLMRFSVSADSNGPVGIDKFTLSLGTSTGVSITDVTIAGYSDAGFASPAGGNTFGRINPTPGTPDGSGIVEVYSVNSANTAVPFQVPAGTTRYFEVRGTVTGATTGSTVTTRLLGDSAYPALATLMGTVAEVDADANDNFIWSPNLSGLSAVTDRDWTNGFGVRNLPVSGLTQTLSR